MNNLHSVLGSIVTAGNLYGWRLDAIVMGGLMWAVLAVYDQIRTTAPRVAWIRA